VAGIALNVFPSIYSVMDGVLSLPDADESTIGQHFMNAVGLKDRDTVIVQSSWSGWSPDGLGYISKDYFERYATEAWISRRWDYGPDAGTAEALLATSDGDEFVRLWRRGRRYGTSTSIAPNNDVRARWYLCWSLQYQRPAEILVVELRRRIRVGVAILVHHPAIDGEPPLSSLDDFFVWPNYRRAGYGRLLEKFAAERATLAGSRMLGMHVWEADAIKGRARAEAFLSATGFNDVEEFSGRQYVLYAKRKLQSD
jgi:GNAT superfamily N-acetyltransferase